MAKQGKTLPARRQRATFDDSLLIRSAETLGRMIGSLQRQLDGVAKKMSSDGGAGTSRVERMNGHPGRAAADGAVASKPARKAATSGSASGARKTQSAGDRTAADRKTKRAAKSAAPRKTAGRSRTGASRKSAKANR
jgi:hypothetical protein